MENLIDKAIESEVKYLSDIIKKLNEQSFDAQWSCVALSIVEINNKEKVEAALTGLPSKGKYVYYIQSDNTSKIVNDYQDMLLTEKKAIGQLPRFNRVLNSSCLYVGSSNNLKKRIREHFGYGHFLTSALKLSRWLKNDYSKISFCYVQLATTDQNVLQHVEDGLWREMKPVFGKPGANNKLINSLI